MKNIIKFAVNYPVTISMIVMAILLLGVISYKRLNVDLLPNLNSPRLFVEISAGERPPEEIEKMFIEDMESTAIRQRDVVRVSSIIKAGTARLTIEYIQNKDMDEAFLDLQKAMNSFSQNSNIESLNITQHDPNTAPVVLVAMSHRTITDMAELRKMAEGYVRNELVRLEGVAEVALSGQEVPILTIKTDPYILNAYGLTMNDISSRISANNQPISGGNITELGMQYLVKSSTLFNSEADFEKLIISYKSTAGTTTGAAASASQSDSKAPLYLGEIATVSFENDRPVNIVRINGERCIGLSIYKEMQHNTVRVVSLIKRQLGYIEQSLPGYNFQIISDQGTFINQAINEVKSSAILGMALAIVVLFVFLRRIGTTFIVSLAIPVSIVATFNLMYFNGLTLNIMTLSGLALGGGMLIDNAIVVIESIFRNQERGLSREKAIITGTSEVSGAVVASTLTTIVVFVPIVYIQGASGELFKDQAWTVAFSLVSSLFVALLVVPSLYKKLPEVKNNQKVTNSIQFRWYSNLLASFLKNRWLIIGISILIFLGTLFVLPFVGTEFLPRSESKVFTVSVKLPEGTRLERTDRVVNNLEYLIHTISGDSLCTVYSHIGVGSSENKVFEGEHTATMKVILSESSPLSPVEIMARFTEETNNTEGLEISFKQDDNSLGAIFGGDESSPIVIEIKGENFDEIASITDKVMDRIESIESIYNLKSSIADGAPELTVSMDRTMAGIYNISVTTIIDQLTQRLQGQNVGKMDYKGEMRDIVIKVPSISANEFQDMIVKVGSQEFRLREIATVKSSLAPKEIFRRNQNRINKITADKDANVSLDKVAQQIRLATKDIELPHSYSITITGEEEKRTESMNSLLGALLLSIILVYMVLASQFESLLHPFTILLTIPLALTGAIALFLITGITINIMGVIGIVILTGIAINNSIILVVRINQLKTEMNLTDAIIQAGQQRIRPIIMTTATTILALLPMSFNIGEGATLRSSMAIAVIGGLITSTLMSLVVIPCVYYVFEQTKIRLKG